MSNEAEKNYVQVQVYLDKATLELLKQIKEQTGAPVSTLVRKAVHKTYKNILEGKTNNES